MNAAHGPRTTRRHPLSEVDDDSDITILRISEEAEEDAGLLVYLEQQGLTPGVRAHVAQVSQSRDSVTIDGPQGQSSMGLRPRPSSGCCSAKPTRPCSTRSRMRWHVSGDSGQAGYRAIGEFHFVMFRLDISQSELT